MNGDKSTLIKDPIILFLETVTYDEVMAQNHILSYLASENAAIYTLVSEHYGWTDERSHWVGQFINWHLINVPHSDWRVNYFFALTTDAPMETLEEQFGELQAIGDSLLLVKTNALKYKARIAEIILHVNVITSLYPLVHYENISLSTPSDADFGEVVAYKNDESQSLESLLLYVDRCFRDTYIYSPTFDVKGKLKEGNVALNVGNFFRRNRTSAIFGINGCINLDRLRPGRLTMVE